MAAVRFHNDFRVLSSDGAPANANSGTLTISMELDHVPETSETASCLALGMKATYEKDLEELATAIPSAG